MTGQWVEIQFDCLPLRSVTHLQAAEDGPPKYRQLVERIKQAVEVHGTFNSYYLHRASCTFHFTNDPKIGTVRFAFEGTVLTDSHDHHTRQCDLLVTLEQETCTWLSRPVVLWLEESLRHAVRVEFDRFIAAGDLTRTKERMQKLQESSDAAGGFLGMGL